MNLFEKVLWDFCCLAGTLAQSELCVNSRSPSNYDRMSEPDKVFLWRKEMQTDGLWSGEKTIRFNPPLSAAHVLYKRRGSGFTQALWKEEQLCWSKCLSQTDRCTVSQDEGVHICVCVEVGSCVTFACLSPPTSWQLLSCREESIS